jgi:dolichol-phosphate mannosyltransferase
MWEKGASERFSSTLVLVAALNEEEGIRPTIDELKQRVPGARILVVDGGSVDNTIQVAKNMGADILFQRGRGKGDAVDCALEHIDGCFEYVVMIDADYTYPAVAIPQMIEILSKNSEVGMVCGNRFNSHLKLEAMRDVFYFGNKVLAFTHNLMNGIALRDPLTGLRVIRTNILENWRPKSDGFDIEVELNHHVERRGYNIIEIEIPYRPRVGEKKLKLRHGITIMKRIISESIIKPRVSSD